MKEVHKNRPNHIVHQKHKQVKKNLNFTKKDIQKIVKKQKNKNKTQM